MSSALDPFGLVSATIGAAREIAGAFVEGWTGGAEQAAPGTRPAVRAERDSDPQPVQKSVQKSVPSPVAATGPSADAALEAKMSGLLARALEQSTSAGKDELFHRILDQIVPDEARIISALSDGSASPLVSVHALSRAGLLGEALIENASLVGRTANVALPALTPTYVGHLLALGLLETGAEDPALKDEYQILQADSDVLKAIRTGSRGPLPARVERRTVRLSALGQSLWAASMGPKA
ncbi:MAG: Abi-alpha family protein [Marmoricola sp.]